MLGVQRWTHLAVDRREDVERLLRVVVLDDRDRDVQVLPERLQSCLKWVRWLRALACLPLTLVV